MRRLELLAPARNADIGIAAIDCGADAVYIAGPDFGARKAAGNPVSEIARLCDHAHKFGAKVFVTFNILLRDDEMEEVHRQMLLAQEAGADAFIIRDTRVCQWRDLHVEMHASTQCAIRTPERARELREQGCCRVILERQLTLEQVKQISASVDCDVEFFVHGALCVGYSGECRLSEYINGRSADRGDCIQACRSLYDLIDDNGKVLVKNKALLSLKDYKLKNRLEDLARAGVTSFKIEGRLKNASYVKNVVREYSLALDKLVDAHPDEFARASFGKISEGFTPDTDKTFNRSYTELYLDGKRGKWSSMEAPKSMGEAIGVIESIGQSDRYNQEITIRFNSKGTKLSNGDGFAFVSKNAIVGFRGDVCQGNRITCKLIPELYEGAVLYRNINTAFEKELDANPCRRELRCSVDVRISSDLTLNATAKCEDGSTACGSIAFAGETARSEERQLSLIESQLSKRAAHYSFSVDSICKEGNALPLISSAALNALRRELAEQMERTLSDTALAQEQIRTLINTQNHNTKSESALLRSKYCIRYELGMCPVHQGAKSSGQLSLVNNGKIFDLQFDCRHCEMTLTPRQK